MWKRWSKVAAGREHRITSCWTFVRQYSSSDGQLICVHNGTRIISRQFIRCSWVKTICEQIYKWTLTRNCIFILNIWCSEVEKKILFKMWLNCIQNRIQELIHRHNLAPNNTKIYQQNELFSVSVYWLLNGITT